MGSMLHLLTTSVSMGITQLLTEWHSESGRQVRFHAKSLSHPGQTSKIFRHGQPSSPLMYSCETFLCKCFLNLASNTFAGSMLGRCGIQSLHQPRYFLQPTCAQPLDLLL